MKKMMLLLCAAMILCFFASCGGQKETVTAAYDLSANPVNIDPQSADTQNAMIVLTHIMEGLYRADTDQTIKPALAEKTDVSADQKTYTITLREDARWFYLDEDKNEQTMPVTAHDFVFAFRRLLRPDTGSSAAPQFFCIENAEAVNAGTLPEESLGVSAQNDRTVVFRLNSANDYFLRLLATTYAMPCNEAFFEETRGRYGLNKNTILSNGAYRISSWDTSSQIRLVKNDAYYDRDSVPVDQIRLRITGDMQTRTDIERLDDEVVEAMLLPGEKAAALSAEGYRVTWLESGTWGILLNAEREPFSNEKIRKSLALCFDRSAYEKMLPAHLKRADTVVPGGASLFGSAFGDNAAAAVAPNPEQAQSLYADGLIELQRAAVTGVTLLVNEDAPFDLRSYFLQVSQLLQRDLSMYISIETVSAAEYKSRLLSGNYDMAAVGYSAADNSVLRYLEPFVTDSSSNRSGYSNGQVDALFAGISKTPTVGEALKKSHEAEQLILSSGVFLPMIRQSDAFVTRKDTAGIFYDVRTGVVDLRNAQLS